MDRLVFYIGGDNSALLLSPGRHIIIIPLIILSETIRVVVIGGLVPLADWKQTVETGFENVWLPRRDC